MALTYDLREVEDRESIEASLLFVMCSAAIVVGIPKLTAGNVTEFIIRARMAQDVHGGWVADASGDRYLSADEIKRFIGLKTNASPITTTAFDRRMADALRERATRYAHRTN